MANKQNQTEDSTLDKLNSNLGNASEKIAQNKKIIFWVVGIIAVVAAFVLSYLFIYRNPRLNKAFEAYNAVEIAANGNDSISAIEYGKVADQFSGTNAGKLASLSAAEALYNKGKYKEALAHLEKFSSPEPVLNASVLVLKGDCYVNLKDYSNAIATYRKAISKADNNEQIVPRVLLKLANIYDEQKNYKEALLCYEQIQKDYPNFQLGNKLSIEAYIERENARISQ